MNESPFEPNVIRRPHRFRMRIILALVGFVCLAALITGIVNFAEMDAFARQAASAEPLWLLLALGTQIASFICAALVWRIVLGRLGTPTALISLFPLSIAKLFADQALPSAGLSGAAFLLHALRRRGVPWEAAFTAFVFGSTTFIAAFLLASIAAIIGIALSDSAPYLLQKGIIGISAFAVVITVLAALIVLIDRVTGKKMRHSGLISRFISLIRTAVRTIAERPWLFIVMIGVQLIARALDAATLWIAGFAIGTDISLYAAIIAVSIASLAATVAPFPLGLGPFEGGLIGVLAIYGIPMEVALTASILYRGLSLWLPLAIGFVIVQRELLEKPVPMITRQQKPM